MCGSGKAEQLGENPKSVSLRYSVHEVPISQIDDFPDHPFHVKMDVDMEELIDSIRSNGIIVPAIVRPKDNQK